MQIKFYPKITSSQLPVTTVFARITYKSYSVKLYTDLKINEDMWIIKTRWQRKKWPDR